MSRRNNLDHIHRTFDSITNNHNNNNNNGRMFCISVVGLSGTEKEKGCLGVGKSCLCNRFIRPQADEYNTEHISILSQPDFSGPIVNNEHWLYWGETRKCTDEGFELTFSVVEQTEFVDDACFQPFRSGKTMEPYYKRCANTRLNSPEKLMYICKNQLGIEKEYEQHYLPDSKFNVDGFICVFDVSQIHGRSIERQIEFTALILNSLLKTKKPVVLATTKNDEASERYVREAEKLVNRREFKGLIPLVETSAHDNVNVDLAFWACVQRDWTKGKTKILSYYEAFQRQQDRLGIVNNAYKALIESNITDYRSHWNNTYSNLSQSQDFITYCDLFGQESAQQTFKRHVKKLKDEYVCRKKEMYLRRLPKIFAEMLPDLESFGHDRSWQSVQQILHQHPLFDNNFVLNESLSWQEQDDMNETRIPFDLLQTPEAQKSYSDYLETLLNEEHLRSLRYQFSELLRETSVVPGQPLREIREQLKGRECVESLQESELKLIYDDYQKILQQDARDQLNELFLERTSLFLQFSTGKTLTQEDLAAISHELSKDDRWLTLDLIPQDRQLALIRHLGFLQWPIKEHCSAGQACVDLNIEAYHASLAKRNTRNPIWNHDLERIQIKFIVLGSTTYADNLATVVKAMCPSLEQENPRVHYEMETIPNNDSLGMFPIRPFANPLNSEAYLCVYSSRSSLEYLVKTFEHSLFPDLQYGSLHPNGLPLVLLLACSPDTSVKERNYLREEGANHAQCLQCAFFDVTSNEPHARFKSDELLRVLIFLSESLIRRAEISYMYGDGGVTNNSLIASNHSIPEGALNPEIRILISLMCGDPLSPARFLESLILMNSLPNLNFYPVTDHSFVTDIGLLLSIDDENDENFSQNQPPHEIPSCYVEFVVSSYHSSYTIKEELFHGNILVFWSKRQASFANMSALASITASLMPIHILALVENESRPSKLSHELVAKGKELANQLAAYFRISTLGSEMGKCISSFLNYCLQNKHSIEKNLQIATANIAMGIENHFNPTISDDCYLDTNNEKDIEQLEPIILSQQAPLTERHESPTAKLQQMTDSLYEKLSDDHHQHISSSHQQKIHNPSSTSSSSILNNKLHSNDATATTTVRNNREQQQQQQQRTNKRFSPENIHLDTFNPMFNDNNDNGTAPATTTTTLEEHLLKPSEMMRQQRRQHLNNNNHNHNYYNLQSYPSADSLDRIYALDLHFSNVNNHNNNNNLHYYGDIDNDTNNMIHNNNNQNDLILQQQQQQQHTTTHLPAHYVYRPSVQRSHMIASDCHSQYLDSSIDQLPPRPASSAHVMIPSNRPYNHQYYHYYHHHNNHQNPPPYSRIAISPPPAYRMQTDPHFADTINSDQRQRLYSNYYNLIEREEVSHLEPNTSSYYQMKHYPLQSNSSFQNQPSSSFIADFNDEHQQSIMSDVHSRNSSLNFVTAFGPRNHSHASQQQCLPSNYHFKNNSAFESNDKSLKLSPFIDQERSISLQSSKLSIMNRKKKKKHSSKLRSSSLSHTSMATADEEEDDDYDINLNNKIKEAIKQNTHSSTKLNNKSIDKKILIKNDENNHDNNDTKLKSIENSNSSSTSMIDEHQSNDYESEMMLISTNDKQKRLNDDDNDNIKNKNNEDEDEDGVVGDEEEEEEEEKKEGEEADEEESCVSYDTSADENINATADKYAVVSSWAYHQSSNNNNINNRSPTNHNRLFDHYQWPPPSSSSSTTITNAHNSSLINKNDNDENNSIASERSKAPGKIDIKKYNNLSNAIGRINLHSPLGSSSSNRSTHLTLDDDMKPSLSSFDDSRIHPIDKRERNVSIKHSSSIKDNDSQSEINDLTSNNNINSSNEQQQQSTSELINLNERLKFNSLKQPIGNQLMRQNFSNDVNNKNNNGKKSRRITPVPVAPPRLPSSANSSNAVTPTSSGVGKSFASFSSYDDSINDKLLNSAATNNDSSNINDDDRTNMDLSEFRRIRWQQFSKLFSLPADNESGISVDDNNSFDTEDLSISTAAAAVAGAASKVRNNNNNNNSSNINANNSNNNNNENGEKAKFLKSKSIGTFPELDKKSQRKAEKMEKKRIKEEERKQRKSVKENSSRNRSRSKGGGGTHSSSLEDFAQQNGNPVPLFIEKCTQFIEHEGLDMEGIYRVPGNRAHVDTLLLKFDENPEINIAELDIPVNAVATALKDFFLKRLPPIFPSNSMTNIANLAKQYTDNGQLGEMRSFIRELPNSNFEILKHMISHFVKITEKSSLNSMDSKNLAICWWPTLLQFEFTNMDLFEQKRPHLMNFVQIMIDSFMDLFSPQQQQQQQSNDSEDNLASADELSSL